MPRTSTSRSAPTAPRASTAQPARGALAGLLLAALALALLPTAAAAETATPLLLDQPRPAAASSGATFQVAGCVADVTGDVRRGSAPSPGDPVVEAPQADTTRICFDYTPGGLGISVDVPGGTDPATDPAWNDFGAGAAFVYTTAGGVDREIQISTQRADGRLEYLVLEGTFGAQVMCSGTAVFSGGTYSTLVPQDCLQAPDVLEIFSLFAYDRNSPSGALTDLVPADGDIVAVPRSTPPGAERITRLAGDSRVETAIAASRGSFDDGEADAVVVASADNYPDALVAAPLAVARQAPVLLTPAGSAHPATLAEAERALGGAGDVILLGGTAALTDAVRDAFRAAGHDVTRIAGDSRFSTSVEAARATASSPAQIILAYGGDFPDALLAGSFAAAGDGSVVVLIDRTAVPAPVRAYLDANPQARTFAMGTIADRVVPDADGRATAPSPSSLSAALLGAYPSGTGEVAVASAESYPDGLAGGAYAGARGIPLLLSPREAMTGSLTDALERYGPFDRITFFGGVAALNDTVAGQAAAHLR